MLKNYHCNRKALRLETIQEEPYAALLHDPKTDRYYADMVDGTDEVYELESREEYGRFVDAWQADSAKSMVIEWLCEQYDKDITRDYNGKDYNGDEGMLIDALEEANELVESELPGGRKVVWYRDDNGLEYCIDIYTLTEISVDDLL